MTDATPEQIVAFFMRRTMTDIITDVEAYRLLLRQLGEAQAEIERHMREKVALAGLVAKERAEIERLKRAEIAWHLAEAEIERLQEYNTRLECLLNDAANERERLTAFIQGCSTCKEAWNEEEARRQDKP